MTPIVAPEGRLFTAAQAGVFLGVTTSKVRKLVARGELVGLRTPGGRLEGIYESDCRAWQQQRRAASAAPAFRPGQIAVDERMRAMMPEKRVFG